MALLLILAGAACRSVPAAIPSGIRLKGDQKFQRQARAALARIQATRTGSRLLSELTLAGKTVTLRFGAQETLGAALYPLGDGDSLVLWDPDRRLNEDPAFLLLYHELVHALHEARQERASDDEEKRAVGLGKFSDYPLSENALRRELGLRLRTSTSGTGFD